MNLVNLWWLCLGALIGWVVQWIWDWIWFRARRRAVSVEVETQISTLQAERDKLALDLKACGERRLALEGEVKALKSQLGELEGLRIRVGELEPLVGRVDTLSAENAKLQGELNAALAAAAAAAAAGVVLGSSDNESSTRLVGSYDEESMSSLRTYNLAMYDELGATRRALVRFSGGLGDPLIDIDGIGPVYQKKLYDQGVITFEQVAAMHPERLRTLVAPNAVFELNTQPWIEQARRMSGTPYRDPLIDIYGVGPVYEQRLLNAGITTFEQVGNMTPDEIVAVIKPAAFQQIDPEAWIKEARELAAQVRAGTYRKGEY